MRYEWVPLSVIALGAGFLAWERSLQPEATDHELLRRAAVKVAAGDDDFSEYELLAARVDTQPWPAAPVALFDGAQTRGERYLAALLLARPAEKSVRCEGLTALIARVGPNDDDTAFLVVTKLRDHGCLLEPNDLGTLEVWADPQRSPHRESDAIAASLLLLSSPEAPEAARKAVWSRWGGHPAGRTNLCRWIFVDASAKPGYDQVQDGAVAWRTRSQRSDAVLKPPPQQISLWQSLGR